MNGPDHQAQIGVATREHNTLDIDALVSLADQARDAAKAAGRNQACTRQRGPFH